MAIIRKSQIYVDGALRHVEELIANRVKLKTHRCSTVDWVLPIYHHKEGFIGVNEKNTPSIWTYDEWATYKESKHKIKQSQCLWRTDEDVCWQVSKCLYESKEQAEECCEGDVVWPYAPDAEGFIEVEA